MVAGPQGRYINSSNLPKEAYFEKNGFTLCDNVTVQRIKVSRVKSKKKNVIVAPRGLNECFLFSPPFIFCSFVRKKR